MRIGFVIESISKNIPRGGAERVLIELANELSTRGHKITIFSSDVNDREEFMYPALPEARSCNLLQLSTNLKKE